MNRLKPALLKAQLELIRLLQLHRLLDRRWGGVGAIFTLHHVRPEPHRDAFAPNRILDITPQFLARTLERVRELGYDVVTDRLADGSSARRFVAFTLDDGYRDNLTHAAAVFERFDAPFTVYVTTAMPDGCALLWWEHLEDVVRRHG